MRKVCGTLQKVQGKMEGRGALEGSHTDWPTVLREGSLCRHVATAVTVNRDCASVEIFLNKIPMQHSHSHPTQSATYAFGSKWISATRDRAHGGFSSRQRPIEITGSTPVNKTRFLHFGQTHSATPTPPPPSLSLSLSLSVCACACLRACARARACMCV